MEGKNLTSSEAKILKAEIDRIKGIEFFVGIPPLGFFFFYLLSKDQRFQEESGVFQMLAFSCLVCTFVVARAVLEEETGPDDEDVNKWSVSHVAKAIRGFRLKTQLACCGSFFFSNVYLSRRYGGMIDAVLGVLFFFMAFVTLSDKWSMEEVMKKKIEEKKKE